MKFFIKKIILIFIIIISALVLGADFVLAGDNDSYTKLLIHADEASGSTNLTDSSFGRTQLNTITAFGNALTTNAVTKFNNTIAFDGTGDYLSVGDSPDWDFGSEDFTVDWWEYRPLPSNDDVSMCREANIVHPSYVFGLATDGDLLIYMTSNTTTWDIASGRSLGSISTNQWVHLAVVRNGNTFYAFKNGNQTDTWSSSGTVLASANSLSIGKYQDSVYWYNVYMDEIRISKGVARWTSNFTPPSAPYDGSFVMGSNWTLCTVSGTAGTGTSYPIPTVDWTFSSLQSDYNDGSAPPNDATPILSAATQESYYIEIDDSSDFGSPEIDISASSTDTQYTVAESGLSFNTFYYWRLKTYDNYKTYNAWLDDNGHSFRSEIEIPTCSALNDSTSQITITASSLTNLAVGTSGTYHDCTGTGCDTGINAWVANGLSDSATGLTANITYTFQVKARNASSTETVYGATCSTYTSANTPGIPVLSSPTASTINVNPTSGGAETAMAIYIEQGTSCDGSGGLGYIQADGSISGSAVWLDDASWATKTVTGLSPSTDYAFCVKARNEDNDETSFSSSAYTTTVALAAVTYPSIKLDGGTLLKGKIKLK